MVGCRNTNINAADRNLSFHRLPGPLLTCLFTLSMWPIEPGMLYRAQPTGKICLTITRFFLILWSELAALLVQESELELFEEFWDDKMFHLVQAQSKLYAQQQKHHDFDQKKYKPNWFLDLHCIQVITGFPGNGCTGRMQMTVASTSWQRHWANSSIWSSSGICILQIIPKSTNTINSTNFVNTWNCWSRDFPSLACCLAIYEWWGNDSILSALLQYVRKRQCSKVWIRSVTLAPIQWLLA